MANRVIYGALPGGSQGLRVSKPGYDVLDAGLPPKAIAFDSRWAQAFRVFKSGPLAGAGVNTTVYLGRTFAVPPYIIIARTGPGGRYETASGVTVYTDRFVFSLASGQTASYYVLAP